MNNLYIYLLVAHVLVAVLGLGSVAAVAIVAATARRAKSGATGARLEAQMEALTWLGSLLRYSMFSIPAMMGTGVLLDRAVAGAFSATWWFRGSMLLLAATGVLQALARRAVRRGIANNDDGYLRRVERIAYGMCALIAVITMLMEVKPF